MQIYTTTNSMRADTGLNPRITHGDAIVAGSVDAGTAIAAFDHLTSTADQSRFLIVVVDGGGVHVAHTEYHWREGMPDPIGTPPTQCVGYYYQWFPISDTGTSDFAGLHRHVTDYAAAHPAYTSASVRNWLEGPYTVVPGA